MTYYEEFLKCKTEEELKQVIKEEAEIAMLFGTSLDRLRAIEDAGNKVLQEKGWT